MKKLLFTNVNDALIINKVPLTMEIPGSEVGGFMLLKQKAEGRYILTNQHIRFSNDNRNEFLC